MITLAAGSTVAGVAQTAATVNFSLSGDEVTTTDSFKNLAQGQLAAAAATIYTVPASTSTLIKQMHLVNTAAATKTFAIYLNGTSSSNMIFSGVLPANGNATYDGTSWKIYDANGYQQYAGNTGPTGSTGPTGTAATIAAGTTSTLAPGASATVTNVGTSSAATFNFGIPQGVAGVVQAVVKTPGDNSITVGGTTANPTIGWGIGYGGTLVTPSKTYTTSDRGVYYERVSGSGIAMTDTLPTLNNTTDVGYTLKVANAGTTVVETITFTAAANTLPGNVTTYVLNFGCRQTFVWSGAKWFFDSGNGNILKLTSGTTPVVSGNVPSFSDVTGRNVADSGVPAANIVQSTRSISTTAPLTGGGDLSANRTLALTTSPTGQTPVGVTRSIGTTAPLTGGGDLSADRTLAISAATTTTAGTQAATDKLKENNLWIDVVAEYGADPTGTVDATTAINNALTAMPAAGGRLFFPTGTYKVSSTITISKPVVIQGQGRGIAVISMTAATGDVFTLAAGAQGAGFEDIRIIGATTGTRTAGYAINLAAQANTYVRRVDILFMWSGVHSSGALQDMDDLNILNGGANASGGAAILVDSTGDRYVRRVVTNQGTSPTGYAAIRVLECSSLVISDCNLINSGNVLDIVPNAGAGHAVASIYAANTFFDTSVIGVNILPATASDTAQRMTFVRCWFSTMSTAGAVLGSSSIPAANSNSIRFIGCEFYQAPVGIDAKGVADWNVSDSMIAGCSTAGIRVAPGSVSGVHSFSIVNNFIGSGAGFGANAIGITIASGTYGHYQIVGNRGLDTNTTIGITDIGTVTDVNDKLVQNNPGAGLLVGPLAFGGVPTFGGVTTEQRLLFATIPANTLTTGTVLRFTINCSATQTAAAVTMTARIRIGTTTLTGAIVGTTGAVSPATARTNASFQITGGITIITVGAGGTALGGVEMDGNFWSARTLSAVAALSSSAVVNTTISNLVEITVQSSAATLTNGVVQFDVLECLRS